MNIVKHTTTALALPLPRTAINIREATNEDIPFIDSLQKTMNRQLGWMPRQQLEGKIKAGHVLVAEEVRGQKSEISRKSEGERDPANSSGLTSDLCSLTSVGYCIGNDQYFKRDDLGCIFQLCVVEGQRRGLIGAALVKAMFDRAAYGCRLFCCWCAQDLEANHFWESLGFVPIAFRTGSRTKGKGKTPRMHIFWQKRIREGDNETPYWFPSKTSGGALGEDRLVLPIPPGTHWSDAKPTILPEPDQSVEPRRRPKPKPAPAFVDPIAHLSPKERRKLPINIIGGLRFMVPAPQPDVPAEKPRRVARKHDPKYVAAARELRDRFLEAVQNDPQVLLPNGKYDVSRALPEPPPHGHGSLPEIVPERKALPEAA